MYRYRVTLATALSGAVLALPGCSGQRQVEVPPEPPPITTTTAAPAPSSSLPAPEALTDVLYRLADPEIPAADKVALIEGAKPSDTATIDKFATALKDGGYLPVNLEAAEVSWSDRVPGHVTADVTVNTANPDTGAFTFPMEFAPADGGWQLSQDTAKAVLAFGKAHAGGSEAAPSAEPAPAPETPTP